MEDNSQVIYIDWQAPYAPRAERLLAWLEAHPQERDILFRFNVEDSRKHVSKKDCLLLAAHAVFSRDEDPVVRDAYEEDPQIFAGKIYDYYRSCWKKSYRKFNQKIGEKASKQRYEDLEKGSEVYKRVKKLMKEFPVWRRLHRHWRTNPYFNQYWTTQPPPFKVKPRQPSKKAMHDSELFTDSDSDIEIISTTKQVRASLRLQTAKTPKAVGGGMLAEPEEGEAMKTVEDRSPTNMQKRRRERSEWDSDSDNLDKSDGSFVPSTRRRAPSTGEASVPHKRVKHEPPSDADDHDSESNDDENDADLSPQQSFDLRMARMRLESRRLELELQKKKNEGEIWRAQAEARALDMKRRHEIRLKLAASLEDAVEIDEM